METVEGKKTMWSTLARNTSTDTSTWTVVPGESHFWPGGPPAGTPRWELLYYPDKTLYTFSSLDLLAAAIKTSTLELPTPTPDTKPALYSLRGGRVPRRYAKALEVMWIRKFGCDG